jgi:archaellum component FlaC
MLTLVLFLLNRYNDSIRAKGGIGVEEILRQLLEGQQQLFEGQKQLAEGQSQIVTRLNHLEDEFIAVKTDLTYVKVELTHIKTDLSGVKTELHNVKAELSEVKADMASKTQQNENNHFIGALLHRTEELNALVTNLGYTSAKIEGMLANAATKDDIADLSAQLQVVNERIFRQETEIRKLKVG